MDTLTSPREIDRLFKRGRRSSDELLIVLASPTPEGRPGDGRVIFVAGRKLGGAVMRNRCKRVLREACRRCSGPWSGFDVALIARHGTADAGPEEMDGRLIAALRRLDVTAR